MNPIRSFLQNSMLSQNGRARKPESGWEKAQKAFSRLTTDLGERITQGVSDALVQRLSVPIQQESASKPKQNVRRVASALGDAAKSTTASRLGIGGLALAMAYRGSSLKAWTAAGAAVMAGSRVTSPVAWAAFGATATLFNIPYLRRYLSKGVMDTMEALDFLPVISETEQTAIEAGSTWMDAELFSGKPDMHMLLNQPYPGVSDEVQEFLDGPVEEVCKMTDDWETMQRGDLSPEVWDYLKEKRFFGLIIPKKYGGHGFSASGNSAVVQKLATRSLALSITVMVPNSLGPAELLMHYGTDEQKERYLERLARGEEIPAFALTEKEAGSDAGAMTSRGEVFEGDDGELYLRLNWKKRYISLASISTLLGLAFRLYDPENLLGKGTDLGITCALIPTDTDGVEVDKRHDPLGIPFYNCPTEGTDVVVPVDTIIGGVEGAGKGWQMLMESLSAGRGISLPAQATGAAKYVTRIAGGHAAVRQQFGLPIGKFEGIEEPLARIAGWTYLMEAGRRYTNSAVDAGANPAVVSAIVKYSFTELQRQMVNDAMDILAGNGISRGPRNLLAHGYQGLPISITVEGANILTRTLMIFGQGAIRCHPYAYPEIKALMEKDVKAFDRVFFKHIGHIARNGTRALLLSLTRGHLASPPVDGVAARYWQKLAWASASFAFLADLAMGSLGGQLKRKEKITGRFADIFIWMYLATATLRRFEAEGRKKEQEPYFHWAMQYSFAQIQKGFEGLFENLALPGLTTFYRCVVAPWSRINPIGFEPSDKLGSIIAEGIQEKDGAREWLTEGIFISRDKSEAMGRLEYAFSLARKQYQISQKVKDAVQKGDLPKKRLTELLDPAVERQIITADERTTVTEAEKARLDYIKVDAFDLEEYRQNRMLPDGPDDIGTDGKGPSEPEPQASDSGESDQS